MYFWIIATFVAYFVKGLCGFANTLVFNGVMGFAAESIAITPTEVILSYPANMIMAYKEKDKINWKLCLQLAGCIVIGTVPGVIFLKNANGSLVKVICGVIIIALGVEMLLREKSSAKFKESKIAKLVIGIICGIMCGVYGIGALMGAYLTRVSSDTHEFKANINMVFVIENTFRIINYVIMGLITLESAKRAAVLMPVMVIGVIAGRGLAKLIDEKKAKTLVIIVLIISGAVLTITNL